MRNRPRPPLRRRVYDDTAAPQDRTLLFVGVVVALLLVAVLISMFGRRPPDIGTQPATPAVAGVQIVIEAPLAGATVANPVPLRGRITQYPFEGGLSYRVYDSSGALVGQAGFATQGAYGGPASFATQIGYATRNAGIGRIEVLSLSPKDGQPLALASVPVNLTVGTLPATAIAATPAQPLPTPVPNGQQQIVIDSPPPGTEVGSPVVITGRTALYPTRGQLSYRVIDATNLQIGAGVFVVGGAPGQGAAFNASLTFNPPAQGGPIRIDVFDQNPQTGAVLGTSSIGLQVSGPQQIVIDSPPPGTQVGSPMTVTGRTARMPFQNNLAYTVTNAAGAQLGAGIVAVSPSGAAGGGQFTGALTFALSPQGGQIRVDIVDQDANNGVVAGRASLTLAVSPPRQQVLIDSPPPGVPVGSPMTVTGRTTLFPPNGQLVWQMVDAANRSIGSGNIAVSNVNGAGTFSSQIYFNLPPQGGPIVLTIGVPSAGTVIGQAQLGLVVSGPPLPTAIAPTLGPIPVLPPVPTTSPQPPVGQQVFIDNPTLDTLVGSPMMIVGRAALFPAEGQLFWLIRDQAGQTIGTGNVPAVRSGSGASFKAQIYFRPPPQGGPIYLDVAEQRGGQIFASTDVRLQVSPIPAATPTAPPAPPIRPVQPAPPSSKLTVTFVAPASGQTVGSTFLISGTIDRVPSLSRLLYRVRTAQGAEIGNGIVPVQTEGSVTTFRGSVLFSQQPNGTAIVVEVAEDRSRGPFVPAGALQLVVGQPTSHIAGGRL